VVVRGKVVEEGTGRPIAGAIVRFALNSAPLLALGTTVATAADGTYRVAGPPGAGYVVVQGPSEDYVYREVAGDRAPFQAIVRRGRFYAHAYQPVELKAGGPDQEVDLSLRPGAAIHGRVVGPDGQPVRNGWVFSRLILSSFHAGGWESWTVMTNTDRGRGHIRDGRFALHGLEPDVEVAACFLDPVRKLGAMARFSGRSEANGPITVRLEPCGTARARLVDPDGRPIAGYRDRRLISMVITPGPPVRQRPPKDGPLAGEETGLVDIDPVNYENNFQADGHGQLTFPALIPGASYRIVDHSTIPSGGESTTRKEFTVKPGETIDLGDVLIAKPQRRN
jgi:hypothetical protein